MEPLPRLLYVGHVPVEASYHGSLLLHRLLRNYPKERLRIVETNLAVSEPGRRIPGVEYRTINFGFPRILLTRFSSAYSLWLSLSAACRSLILRTLYPSFEPEAVLTAAHGYAWITAAAYAKRKQIPLHLVLHDDWPRIAGVPEWARPFVDHQLARVYRAATSRLCISPQMEETYQKRYGVGGTILYPCRDDAETEPIVSARTGDVQRKRFNVVFAGTVVLAGYARALELVARAAERVNGRLLIFGPTDAKHTSAADLTRANIEWRGLLPPDELRKVLQQEADVLFVPMSFEAADADNMKMGFPSKLADYTATGIPLLIYGPPYCSAIRWARENPGVAEFVESPESEELDSAVQRLASDPALRKQLGSAGLEIGNKDFSNTTVVRKFFDVLRKTGRE